MIRSLGRLHSDESGQVLWFFAMTFLAALVVNTGRQISRKVEMQNAADAAAISSATWIARGMNVISMDNVGMTEALGLIANLQAMHVAWQVNEIALDIEQQVAQALTAGVYTAPLGIALQAAVLIGRIPTYAVKSADSAIEGASRPTSGALWQFMRVLSGFSQAVSFASPTLAFAEAYNVGTQNIARKATDEFTVAFMMPNFGNGMTLSADDAEPQQISGGYGLPVAQEDFRELCDPSKTGTPSNGTAVNTRGYVPLRLRNVFDQQYDQKDQGPFEKYKNDFDKVWWPSFITGMPFGIYGMLADMSMSTFCGGSPPSPPDVSIRIADLDKARETPGASDFTWIHTHVETTSIPVSDPICSMSTNSACFEPTNSQKVSNQLTQLVNSGATNLDALQKLENSLATPPAFNSPVDGSTYESDGPMIVPDANWPAYPTCEPQIGGDWCRLSRRSVFEKITQGKCVRNSPQNNPTGQLSDQNPQAAAPEFVYCDDRWIFQYATATRSIAEHTKGLSTGFSSDEYPQPMHFSIGDADLTQYPNELPAAIQRLQYLAVAYRGIPANPWPSGARVALNGTSRNVFSNPNTFGLLTYAQSQVYNPTSWDLYTQNWHAKLVPATLLERPVGQFRSSALNNAFRLVSGLGSRLNAH